MTERPRTINPNTRRVGRIKVKTGCRTCKLRKVKCDERKPACYRCVSTGRVCDGYGIFGGGGNTYGDRCSLPKRCDAAVRHKVPSLMGAASSEEIGYFEWFICQTAPKLQGAFASAFWNQLVFQASINEPTVRHAVLALSSAHKNEITGLSGSGMRKDSIPDEREQFTLQQYSKAIRHLQPHFYAGGDASIRVALITCLLFICMEFLRGRYRSGNAHLQNGLKLLGELQTHSSTFDKGAFTMKPSWDFISDWILEPFARLHVQTGLFGQGCRDLYLNHPAPNHVCPALVFSSINQARLFLDRLLERILHLSQQTDWRETPPDYARLIEDQRRLQAELVSWKDIYKASKDTLQTRMSAIEGFGYRILPQYHSMAKIMAATCLGLSGEAGFDSYLDEFVSILTQSIEIWKAAFSPSFHDAIPGHGIGMSRSISDTGGIPPLYYIAIKCRNHRVRLQAIRLLESSSHKEGIWNSMLAACIAREVMRIEECDFYREYDMNDEFSLLSPPEKGDFSFPPLPESCRVYGAQVVLPDDAMCNITLECRRRRGETGWEIVTRNYDSVSQTWRAA